MPNLGLRADSSGTFGAITLGGVDKVIVGSQGIEAGSFKPGAVVPADLAQKLTLGNAQATASVTYVEFPDVPSWAKRITVSFAGFSTSGTSSPRIQIGPSSGVETTGYSGATSSMWSGAASFNGTTGIELSNSWSPTVVVHGSVVLTLQDANANRWCASGFLGRSDTAATYLIGYSKTLSGALSRVKLVSTNGTDTFDAGSVNILYEG